MLFRRDLRLEDNPALAAAAATGQPVIPLYVWDRTDDPGRGDGGEAPSWRMGEAQQWWLHHSLASLDSGLRALGSRLIVRSGETYDVLCEIADQEGVEEIYWSRRYEPVLAASDRRMQKKLASRGTRVHTYAGTLLHDPDEVCTTDGTGYQVFTPFYRKFLEKVDVAAPLACPSAIVRPRRWPDAAQLKELALLPTINWAGGFAEVWKPGERAAHRRLGAFADSSALVYGEKRDELAIDATSRLSPRLALGELSPRHVWNAVRNGTRRPSDEQPFLRQLVWREFSYHVLHHNPESDHRPLREKYEHFPWADDATSLERWQRGKTGYPIVDAAMRQLWATGWMHNRARMVVASFLTKHLRQHWLHGARWFWDTLVDADLANNSMGWQWSAGSGADAQPYFRVFNPILQGKKFDAEGEYVKRWIPELSDVPTRFIHEPWNAGSEVLRTARVTLGKDYPQPIVEHSSAREAALAAYEEVRATES